MPPQAAPATIAAVSATRVCTTGGRLSEKPTHTAASAPAIIWPLPPMLNRPARKPKARPRPEMINGIAKYTESISGLIVRTKVDACGSTIAPRNIA